MKSEKSIKSMKSQKRNEKYEEYKRYNKFMKPEHKERTRQNPSLLPLSQISRKQSSSHYLQKRKNHFIEPLSGQFQLTTN